MTEVTLGMIRLEYKGPVKFAESLAMAPEQAEGVCPVDQGVDIFRPVRQGAIVARKELTAHWQPGSHGNTFGGNALACAAANTVLDLVQEELAANAARVGAYLREGLEELQGRYEQIGDVRGRGLMLGVEFVKDRATREPAKALANEVMEQAFKRGALLLTCGASTIRFCPPLTLTEAQVDEGLTIFEAALQASL